MIYRPSSAFRRHARKQATLETTIASFEHAEAVLRLTIKAEEDRAEINDLRDPSYPFEARAMRGRLDNICATITRLRHEREELSAA